MGKLVSDVTTVLKATDDLRRIIRDHVNVINDNFRIVFSFKNVKKIFMAYTDTLNKLAEVHSE